MTIDYLENWTHLLFFWMDKMSIKVTHFRAHSKNTLQGFFTAQLTNIGLEIRDATLHEKDGKRWIGLPAKPYEKEDGTTGYAFIVKFYEKDKWNQFQKATLEALDKYHETS